MTRTGDGAEAPPVADAARRRKGKSQAGKAAPKLPPHAPITFLGDELVEFDSPLFAPKQKKSAKSVDLTVFGDPYENRTRVTAVKGRCLNRLTNGPYI